MQCCGIRRNDTGRFFSLFARVSKRRYQRKGLGRSQEHLLAGLTEADFSGASILDIGCGVGYLHQMLIRQGAAGAVGVDMSEKMLAEARSLAEKQSLSEATEYRFGDFVELAPSLDEADITILDKVVCCYPDAQSLVSHSLQKTRAVYALTYPRSHLFNRINTRIWSFVLWLSRSTFRSYVHDPALIERWIVENGCRKQFEDRTLIWLTQVYTRPLQAAQSG